MQQNHPYVLSYIHLDQGTWPCRRGGYYAHNIRARQGELQTKR